MRQFTEGVEMSETCARCSKLASEGDTLSYHYGQLERSEPDPFRAGILETYAILGHTSVFICRTCIAEESRKASIAGGVACLVVGCAGLLVPGIGFAATPSTDISTDITLWLVLGGVAVVGLIFLGAGIYQLARPSTYTKGIAGTLADKIFEDRKEQIKQETGADTFWNESEYDKLVKKQRKLQEQQRLLDGYERLHRRRG
jgi:hypothetical protein